MGTICPTNTDVSKGELNDTPFVSMSELDSAPACTGRAGLTPASGRLRPVVLAIFVASTMTACAMGFWQEPTPVYDSELVRSGESDERSPEPEPMPAQTFPVEPVDNERKARKSRSAATSRQAQRNKGAKPPRDEAEAVPPEELDAAPPEIIETPSAESTPAVEWTEPLAIEEVPTPDLAPPPLSAEAGGSPVTWLVVVSCSMLGGFLLWRRRRERRRRMRREAWTPIRWGGPKLIRPHWDYDPGHYDSDDFLRRWDSIALSISGEWGLLMAIAGHAVPNAYLFSGWRQPAPRAQRSLLVRPHWRYAPLSGDAAEHLARWCRLGLSLHGDPREASMSGSQVEWRFAPSMAAVPTPESGAPDPVQEEVLQLARFVEPVLEEEVVGHVVDVPFELHSPMSGEADGIASSEVAASPIDIVVPAQEPIASIDRERDVQPEPRIFEPAIEEPMEPVVAEVLPELPSRAAEASAPAAPAATPPEDRSGMAWLAGIGPLLHAWEADAAAETEPALWDASRRLAAHAEALPQAARTPWLDAAEALAERVARSAPEASRGAWQAHWIELRLARLAGMSGAWRLLELRALHDAGARFTAPETLDARIHVLHVWAAALLGPAAKAKHAEAAALAASLRPAQTMRA
ncbi:hypothetical protein [Dyella sp. 2RAB6]|uniref:hypothetical protein n=1 Tax=Dyella sp. 2RAB6 TaxID=3232992 RepID=UPI003F90CE44